MLTIHTWPSDSGGRGIRRRDVLRAGTFALGGLTLADGMPARVAASSSDGATSFVRQNKAVVLLFLAGGPSQYETFDPKPEGFDSHTSIAGHLATKLPGVRFSSYFPEMAARADRLTIVRSMVAKTANHAKAAKNLLTGGFEDPNGREGAPATFPSMGAAYAHARGATDPRTGMPSYATVPPVFDKVDGLTFSSVNPGVESVTKFDALSEPERTRQGGVAVRGVLPSEIAEAGPARMEVRGDRGKLTMIMPLSLL